MKDKNIKDEEVLPGEEEIEEKWKKQKGIDPETGKIWLTPRMERDAKKLAKHWEMQIIRKIEG